jgi:hypothetical protein
MYAKTKGKKKQKLCEIQQNLPKPRQFEKSKTIYFLSGVETSGEIPRSWWQMVMIGDENGDDFASVSTYSQKRMPIQIQLLKNQSSKIDAIGYRLTVRRPRGQVEKPYG